MSIYLRKKEGSSPGTIVFVHGNSGSSKLFDSIFSSEIFDQTLLAPDLPGHGKSLNGFDFDNYGFVSYRKILIDLINSIDDDMLLVGISLGGHLVMETLDEVNNVKGVVLSGSPPIGKVEDMANAFVINELLGLFSTENCDHTAINNTFNSIVFQSAVRSKIKKDFLSTDPKVRLAIAESFSDPSMLKDEIKLLEDFKGEKLFIQGADDPMLNQDYLMGLGNKNIFRLEMLKNCGHYPSLESSKSYIELVKTVSNACFS
jgi:pimeloyl-ACP methyl ester carboxylesterase